MPRALMIVGTVVVVPVWLLVVIGCQVVDAVFDPTEPATSGWV